MTSLTLDMMQTLALAAVVLFAGYGIRSRVGVLDRYNIPAPVVGGFLFAGLLLVLRLARVLQIEFDTALQAPLMIAFFTTVGLGASVGLLKAGGPQVLVFWALASGAAIGQNIIGVSLATAVGVEPLLGLIAGSITMTGGHGTGAAFGQLLEEEYRVGGGVALAMAAATFGLVTGGLTGGPVATTLIRRHRPPRIPAATTEPVGTAGAVARRDAGLPRHAVTAYALLKVITVTLVAMWAGSLISGWLGRHITLPAYIGAMIAAAIVRNLDDLAGIIRIEQRLVDDLGTIALSLFLAMALMSLRLWELLDLAIPMLIILAGQVAVMAAFAYFVTFRVMGRDYEAAVMAGGHCGFGLGATPSAVANMEAIVERFGAAPRAFLVLPIVAGFFIDFSNALIITAFINALG